MQGRSEGRDIIIFSFPHNDMCQMISFIVRRESGHTWVLHMCFSSYFLQSLFVRLCMSVILAKKLQASNLTKNSRHKLNCRRSLQPFFLSPAVFAVLRTWTKKCIFPEGNHKKQQLRPVGKSDSGLILLEEREFVSAEKL